MPIGTSDELNMIKQNIEHIKKDCSESIMFMREHNELLPKLDNAFAKLWGRILYLGNNKEYFVENFDKTYEELSDDFTKIKDRLNELSTINIEKIENLKTYTKRILSLEEFKKNAPVELYKQLADFHHKLLELSRYPHIRGDFSEFMKNYDKAYTQMINCFDEEIKK